ncbi:hypothetical protein AB0F20_29770 [Streptomyces goshikiensis]|uniref:hypothetical protein n=1 Tax=Streptomyces goshikiensis TaxID=1942 RepID=UPI0033DEFA4A
MNQRDICTETAACIADGLGTPWAVGPSEHGPGPGPRIVHPDGRVLLVGAPRMHPTAYVTIRAQMPAGGETYEPAPVSARADRGQAIAKDISRKLLPAYAAALDSARQHVQAEAHATARRQAAATHLAGLVPGGRWSWDHPDATTRVTAHLALPDAGRDVPVLARAWIGGAGETADLRIERLPLDIAAQVMRVLARAARAPASRPAGHAVDRHLEQLRRKAA